MFLVICLSAGGLGAVATTPEIDGWYGTIAKPVWNPPNWIFGPVWTTLFVIMAFAGWLVWKQHQTSTRRTALAFFGLQLILNTGWSWIFFGLHQPGWAFVEIVVLWGAILATTVSFYWQSRVAGCLMAPYLAWVSFAAVLNFTIWSMNR